MTKILAYDQTILSKLPHQTLTSLQCFTHAINYGHVDTQEILLTISTHPEHIAPNTIILDEKKLSHFADLPVQIELLFIRLGRRQLTLADAQIWQPTPLYLTPSKTKIAIFLTYIQQTRFNPWQALFPASPSTFLFDSYSRTQIQKEMIHFQQAWEQKSFKIALDCLTKILGLGIGLTPTGDDFITGLLASFSALKQLPSNFQQLAVLAKERTNAVSYAEIHEAVNERFSQLVQRVFLSIESGNTNEMAQAVSALEEVGSTSGSDILCGIIFGLKLFCEENNHDNSNSN
ncbi:DUF2877 domain-containing protein [Enterococcus faecalis]|uniref:DUF2877 domain-containing protein n=1 Tax=Enterococcus faecalis TaxID=1351 RepID=UPI0019D90187|nr:DUF2877 domain-containing protein [Enterococcus faecalis]EGO9027367.1 DUF2877 domain-containing protein [Enterococcus faecalis]EHQ9040729.1 DUF2877 domain-containing protein [Enterococcus faecalis]EHR4735986.1 DUF2877 domain-containing protein [Enterococcus faecalis]EIF1588717.1 DUF2877 domain-containing protein [Enterococcus faecalis]